MRIKTFRIIMLLLPIAFFAILEVVLRVTNYGGDLRLFRERVINGKPYYAINPDVPKRYFRTIQMRAMMSNDVFEKEKRPNTCRIFCLGESSTLGYPYYYNGAFPSLLKDRLETLWPEKNFEVINLGITAVNSYTVADFVHEIVDYHPDAILVYCGHNEFYGALGVASTESLGKSRWMIKAYLALENWRTFRFLRDGLNAIKEMISSSDTGNREATMMEVVVSNREIAFGSDDYLAAVDNFRANVEEIATTAASRNVPVVFGTLVSNMRGLAPFISVFSSGTTQSLRDEWENLFRQGADALQDHRFDEAEQKLVRALRIDPFPAKGNFVLGRLYESTGRFERSREQYRLARDYDGLRFRAPSVFNDIIAEVSAQNHLHVAEAERLVEEKSDHGLIGDQFALEHVHLNIDGYSLLAKAFFEALADGDFIAARSQWHWERDRPDSLYRALAGVTPLDSVVASIRLHVLINSWPFRTGAISVKEYPAQTKLEQLGKSYLIKEYTWEEMHIRLAEQYESEGSLDSAAQEYFALTKAIPFNTSAFLRLGRLLLQGGKDEEARVAFEKALKIEPGYFAHQGIGFISLQKNQFALAAEHFRKALQYADKLPPAALLETRHLLAVSLARGGDLAEAERVTRATLAAYPSFTPDRELLERILQARSQQAGKGQ